MDSRLRGNDDECMGVTATLTGIARHARPRGDMEPLDRVHVSVDAGIDGDCRGVVKPGGRGRRQVSMIAADDWAVAMAGLGLDLPWQSRRANLLVDGFDLPQVPGTRVRIGADVVLEITQECDPCSRMEEIAPGLKAALTPDWRGGALARVITGGVIAVGDAVVVAAA